MLFLTAFALFSASAPAQNDALSPNLSIASGSLHGAAQGTAGVLAFKSIPYAAPPVGDLRWRAPQPLQPWIGSRDATEFRSRCWSALVQTPTPLPPQNEDCLTLNVWTAAKSTAEKHPVMVWVHGGGFEFGSSTEPQLDGARLAQKGVVVVTFNYRLGVFGFMAHPDLDREGPSGDYGLQDQIAALKWVQANIASFGGDPANVTLFGESAGSHAIGILMASPLTPGLFHKVIGSSGAFWDSEHGSLATFHEAHERGVQFAASLHAASVQALRALPPERLNTAAAWSFKTDPVSTAFSPNIDGYVVPAAPATRFLQGKQIHVPLLAGWTAHEDVPFGMWAIPHASAEQFRRSAATVFGEASLRQFLQLYPASTDTEAAQSAIQLAGDMVIAEQTWEWLDLHRRTSNLPVYGYKFSYTSPYLHVAAHATDVPFVFGTLTPSGSGTAPGPADRAESETVMAYFINFARSGNPNGPGLPAWPTFDGSTVLDLGTTSASTTPAEIARFRFLAGFRHNGVLPAAWRNLPSPDEASH